MIRPRERAALMAVAVGLVGAAAIIVVDPRGGGEAAADLATVTTGLPDDIVVTPTELDEPRPLRAPRSGTYTYASETRVAGGDYGGSTTTERDIDVEIVDAGPDASGGRLLRTSQDGGDVAMVWRDDEVAMRELELLDGDCIFAEPLRTYVLPLQVGGSWTSSGQCQLDERGVDGIVDVEAETVVVSAGRVDVGGDEVEVMVLETRRRTTLVGTFQGARGRVSADERVIDLLAPGSGVVVVTATEGAWAIENGQWSQSFTRSETRRLRSMTPEDPA